jgi:hypothetical protein
MWIDPQGKLIDHLEKNNTLRVESLIIAEWNMNDFQTIKNYGTYRFRPSASASKYNPIVSSYSADDTANYYTNAARSFFTYSDFVNNNDEPVLFENADVDRQLYFDLEDCFAPFRPRSGINKLLYFNDKYIDNVKSAKRPRYYMASRYDNFKYWNSYRNQIVDNVLTEVGVSNLKNPINKPDASIVGYYIDDTAPFVVYEKAVPTNRIVIKMQTNLAKNSLGNFNTQNGTTIQDPLGNRSLSSIPKRWRIEYLDINNNWVTAQTFNENSKRLNGTEIVDWDGYVELYYGVLVPEEYRSSFHLVGYLSDLSSRPPTGINRGESYVIGMTQDNPGTLYIWNNVTGSWYSEAARYGFSLVEQDDTKKIGIVSSLTDPVYFNQYGQDVFTELLFIKGLRLVIETMIAPEQTFSLIELSPRLKVNVSDYVESFQITKSTGNDQTQLPVGGLLASNGDVSLMNFDDAFTLNNYNSSSSATIPLFANNKGSLVSQYLKPNVKFDFYEIILDVDGYDKYIPMQSMYSENFPYAANGMNDVRVILRDQFFKFETTKAPEIFLTDTTVTSAISMLLDNAGFSNYVFKGIDDLPELYKKDEVVVNTSIDYPVFYPPVPSQVTTNPYLNPATGQNVPLEDAWNIYWNLSKQYNFTPVSKMVTNINKRDFYASIRDPIIPFFFIGPEMSIAQALSNIAAATQTAMFFDEYNNFVVMPKEYFMPNPEKPERKTDLVLYGQKTNGRLPNILAIGNNEEQILNSGVIRYTIKYIQKSFSSISQARFAAQDRTYIYKPVLLWEAGSNDELRPVNDDAGQASGYALTAMGLNTTLSSAIPIVVNNKITNNVIDVGENVNWLGRFNGYLYANGEVIRFDAVEYKVTKTVGIPTPQSSVSQEGTVWITSNREYQKYFSSLPFGGKIYPTGNIRIFVEPYYVKYENPTQDATDLDTNVTYKNGAVQRHGRGQFGTEIVEHPAGLPAYWSDNNNVRGIEMDSTQTYLFSTKPITSISYPTQDSSGTAVGVRNDIAQRSKRNGIIKNFLRKTYPTDKIIKDLKTTQSGTIQSSALVFVGPPELTDTNTNTYPTSKINFVSYVYKELDSAYRHFGTRLRIIGKYERDSEKAQTVNNGTSQVPYYTIQPENSSEKVEINGGSGGIAIGINPSTNQGYFFEICALTGSNIQQYNEINSETGAYDKVLHNIVFYKVQNSGGKAIPRKLWGGLGSIIVDEGTFVGQDRIGLQENPTVYDLSVEYQNLPGGGRRFYLYINNKQIAYVDDTNPLPEYNNVAVFVRGASECMFENIYALQSVLATNTNETVIEEIKDMFYSDEIKTPEAMRKYSVSGFVKPTYLTGIGPNSSPKYKIYFEEFGTIMRECAYFNVKYDKAYPALLAVLAPTFNNERGYVVSGFRAGAYGAEFLVFNTTDKAISLDETTGNYLRILGITFTQESNGELSVDSYFNRKSSFSNPTTQNNIIQSPIIADKVYDDILLSRKKYGKKEFVIESEYIQSEDDANNLMDWMMTKTLRQRQKLSISTFATPHVQLGDLVSINYKPRANISFIDSTKQFVVQSISHSIQADERSTELVLVEI